MSEFSLTVPFSAYNPSKESLSDRNPYRYAPTLVVVSRASHIPGMTASHVPDMKCYLPEDGVGIIIKADAYGTTIHSGGNDDPRGTLDAQKPPSDYHIYPNDSSFAFYPQGIAGPSYLPISEIHRPACLYTGNGVSCIFTRAQTQGPYPLHPSLGVQTPWTSYPWDSSNSFRPSQNSLLHDSGSQDPPINNLVSKYSSHTYTDNGNLDSGYLVGGQSGHQTDLTCYRPPIYLDQPMGPLPTNSQFLQGPHSGSFNRVFGVDNYTTLTPHGCLTIGQ